MIKIRVERVCGGGYQGVLVCEEVECWRGRPWNEYWQAYLHAGQARAEMMRRIEDGLARDLEVVGQ
jgi:hypothetical protein